MSKDYHFLIGQRFSVKGEVYVVSDLIGGEEHPCVQASSGDITVDEIVPGQPPAGVATETFEIRDVIQWLLVDEEIELFSPHYLAAG